MIIPFTLPPPESFTESPVWDGSQFLIGSSKFQILEYSENFKGWSDDLTALHEELAGDSHPIDVASRADAISQVKKNCPDEHAVIMEIGCSSGFLIRDLVKYFPQSVVIGADVVKEPLNKLAQSLPTVPLIRFDLLKSPLPQKCVDILIMLNVLEHIEDDISALKNAFELLKPGGILIIEVPAGPKLYDDYDEFLQHFRRYSASNLKAKLNMIGFEIKRKSHLGFILFPAFAIVKCLNRLFPKSNTSLVVRNSASKTGNNVLVSWAMNLESKYFRNLRLPVGIRILITAQKPL